METFVEIMLYSNTCAWVHWWETMCFLQSVKFQETGWIFQDFCFLYPWIWHYLLTTEINNQKRKRQNLQSWECFTVFVVLKMKNWLKMRKENLFNFMHWFRGCKNIICYMSPFVNAQEVLQTSGSAHWQTLTKLFSFPITYITASLILPKNSVVKHQERNWITPTIAFHHSQPLTTGSATFPSLPQCSEQSLPIAVDLSKAVRPTEKQHLFLNKSFFTQRCQELFMVLCDLAWLRVFKLSLITRNVALTSINEGFSTRVVYYNVSLSFLHKHMKLHM